MEMILLLTCSLAILIIANVHGAAIEAPLDIISLDDLSQGDRDILTYLEEEAIRKKRSDDIFGMIKAKLAQGIKSKVGHIASASAHLSGKDDKEHHHYGPPPESYDEKSFDFWDLQKSILNTLVQAVKAIKGGILAVKGHLIKGGGYIISAKGKLISAKGEAITNIGKHIASTALLSPRPSGHSAPGHEYGPPSSSGFSGPSAHGVEYIPDHHSPPHGSYSDHKFPPSYEAYKDHLPRGAHHGILVLKKIPKGHKDKHNGNDGLHIPSDKHKPDFKPEEPSAPSYSFFPNIKSIFSASSHKEPSSEHLHSEHPHSEDPHSEHPHSEHPHSEHPHSEHPHFEHSHSEHAHYEHSQYEQPHSEHVHYENSHTDHSHSGHSNEGTPLPHYESPPTYYGTPATPHDEPAHHDTSFNYYKAPPQYDQASGNHNQQFNQYELLKGNAAGNHLSPPATSYGTPLEIPENNFRDYFKDYKNLQLAHSINGPQPTALSSNIHTQLPKLETYDPLKLPNLDNPTPLTVSLSNLAPQKNPDTLRGLEHFPTYPINLSTNFGAQQNNPLHYSVHEPDSDFSASKFHELVLPDQISSRRAKDLHSFPDSLIINPNILKKYLLAHNRIQNKQSSHTRSVSRQKRPKNYDFARSSSLRPRRPIKI